MKNSYLLFLSSVIVLTLFTTCKNKSEETDIQTSMWGFLDEPENFTGLEFTSADKLKSLGIAMPGLMQAYNMNIPKKKDLSDKMPPVKAQGKQPSCVAWALAYACRSYYNLKFDKYDFKKDSVSSFQRCASPAFLFNSINKGDLKPLKMVDALEFLRTKGSCSINRMTYDENDWQSSPNDEMKLHANAYRIESYVRLPLNNAVSEIKAQILKENPVLAGAVYDGEYFENGYGVEGEYIWKTVSGQAKSYGHAIVITGYDDERRLLKFMNSWGTEWGGNGFGFISYDIAPKVIREAYVIKPYADYMLWSQSGDGYEHHSATHYIGDTSLILYKGTADEKKVDDSWCRIDTAADGTRVFFCEYDTTFIISDENQWADAYNSETWLFSYCVKNGKVVTNRYYIVGGEPARYYNRVKDDVLARSGQQADAADSVKYKLHMQLTVQKTNAGTMNFALSASLPEFLLITPEEWRYSKPEYYLQLYKQGPNGLQPLNASGKYASTDGSFIAAMELPLNTEGVTDWEEEGLITFGQLQIPISSFESAAGNAHQLIAIPSIVIDGNAIRFGRPVSFSF